ncbi:nitroreductase [Thermovirga lienii DSM 17291]|jgi:nitroreductase|uniref:Nitroreductase n=1 Tax=Thermovirga lienii (strain ATCC BAA-1197 / DSM 17291 / Cas60314) TaxID=580340 RepID=G7V793_THELD|nr:nitroreductase family protein [Thermovirga lienii]AER66127.1 nitroreductase [Thermovirga lienii DSM 17291]HCD71851.1 nitroreductase family protein [Thermovirga lienii]
MNETIQNILARRSIRRFQEKQVEREKVKLIVECAFAAPSAGNSRPAHFIIVEDKKVLRSLGEAHPFGKMLKACPLAIVVCGDPTQSDLASLYWEEDCSAAMENILLASQALGLGSVWLGVQHNPQVEFAVKEILSVPSHIKVLGIAAIGYPAEKKDPHEGILDGKVHLNKW